MISSGAKSLVICRELFLILASGPTAIRSGKSPTGPPGPDIAVFYRHNGQTIPAPGLIIIGKVESGVETLNVPGSLEVTIELAKN